MALDPDFGAALDPLSFPLLALLAVGMALAPWPFGPEPHLIQKTQMLLNGTLSRPIDVFDLCIHALPTVLLGAKAIRMLTHR